MSYSTPTHQFLPSASHAIGLLIFRSQLKVIVHLLFHELILNILIMHMGVSGQRFTAIHNAFFLTSQYRIYQNQR